MRVSYAPKFKENLQKFPLEVRSRFYKQVNLLLKNFRYPSLDVKKYDEIKGVWQARVDRKIRFYFLIEGNEYILLYIKKHPK